jgi:glycosyltransferase involved in cell wall biosynthesis
MADDQQYRARRVVVIGARAMRDVIGGIETHCAVLYPALASQAPDLNFTIVVRLPYTGAADCDAKGLTEIALPSPRNGALETLVHTLHALLRFGRSADIVHLHGIGPGFFTPLARVLGAKVVVTHHAADFERPKWGFAGRAFLRLGEYLAGRFAHRVICVSDALRRDFLTRTPHAAARTVTITHGAVLASPEGPGTDDRIVRNLGLQPGGYLLAVGRMDETKRFDDLIAARAAARPGTLPLVIVGSGVGNTDHEAQLRATESPDVIFLGGRQGQELAALYRRCALFLHASAMEGFGLVILEALVAGAPVRVSDIPVHREFGLPDHCYFPVGDLVALDALMEEAKPRDRPWPGAAPIAARYSLSRAAAAHLALYRALMPPRKRSNTAQ